MSRMTVGELKQRLERYDENAEVAVVPMAGAETVHLSHDASPVPGEIAEITERRLTNAPDADQIDTVILLGVR